MENFVNISAFPDLTRGVTHLNGSILITDSQLMLNDRDNPVDSNIGYIIERGVRRSVIESHLASCFIGALYHSVR